MRPVLIIIPTHCEGENIPLLIPQLLQKKDCDVLVVDDLSTDNTIQAVQQLQQSHADQLFLLARNHKQGIGAALLAGIHYGLEKNYSYFVQMDADLSHNPNDVSRLVDSCAQGYDLSIGSRYVEGINVVNWPMSRILLSYFANSYVRLATGLPIRDATAGFVCYRRALLEHIDMRWLQFSGYAFQVATKFVAWRSGAAIKEISVVFTDRQYGKSKMSLSIFKNAFFSLFLLIYWRWGKKFPPLHQNNKTSNKAS